MVAGKACILSEKSLHTKLSLSFKFKLRSNLVETQLHLTLNLVAAEFKLSKTGFEPKLFSLLSV